jgi:hypothetical protein
MTPAQQREIKRLSPTMWSLLIHAATEPTVVAGHHLAIARKLARRGFVTEGPKGSDG